MATTRPYINHLLQNVGITPACSEEERVAAEDIARIFAQHGFEPEVQEFTASPAHKQTSAILGIAAFMGALLMGVGGMVGVVGLLLALAAAVVFTLERMGRPILSKLGSRGLSQNVIAYHQASGPLASPRNRPVVVVAHYDSPRADLFSQMPYAAYRPVIVKLLPYAMLAPAIIAVLRLFPFPAAAKAVFWILAIVIALVPLAHAVGIIMNRYVLPYTSGSVCNKSSVAAMLGVMNAVAPFKGQNEFPQDIPFDDYFAEQRRIAEELARAAELEGMDSGQISEAESEEDMVPGEEPAPVEQAVAEQTSAFEVAGGVVGALDADSTASMQLEDEAPEVVATPAASDEATGATQAMSVAEIAAAMSAAADATEAMGSVATPREDAMVTEDADTSFVATEPIVETVDEGAASVGSEAGRDAVSTAPAVDAAPAAEVPTVVNAAGNYRFGPDVIHALGMVPETCEIEYLTPAAPEPAPTPTSSSASVVGVAPTRALSADQDEQQMAPAPMAAADVVFDGDDAVEQSAFEMAALVEDEPMPAAELEQDAVDGFDGLRDDAYDLGEDEGLDDDEGLGDERVRRSSYETEDLDFSPRPTAASRAHNGIAETLTLVGERAMHLFDSAVQHGKEAIADFKATHTMPFGIGDESPEDEELDAEGLADERDDLGSEETTSSAAAAEVDETEEFSLSEMKGSTAVYDASMLTGGESVADEVEPVVDSTASAPVDLGATVAQDISSILDTPAPASGGATQAFSPEPVVAAGGGAQADAPAGDVSSRDDRTVETVDSLMAEISSAIRPTPQQRASIVVPDPAQPSIHEPETSNRSSLFDLPDPSVTPIDPFAPDNNAGETSLFSAMSQADDPDQLAVLNAPLASDAEAIGTITADAPVAHTSYEEPKRRRGLFRRKKNEEQSMSEYLGLDDSFDARQSGREIGSWDNFGDDDWKGGATGAEGVTAAEMRDAITSLGDDELLGHDIWFVATGASEYDNAGMNAFLDTHRDKLRGVFLINLECVGAGQVAMLATEGDTRVLRGDRRIMNLVRKVSSAFHHEFGSVEMPYLATDAYAAMSRSLRSLTIAGVEGPCLACSHSEEDLPYNVDVDNIDMVADVVTEVIRRS